MDADAILAARTDDLTQLGLKERGHILCLKAYAMQCLGGLENNKENLAMEIKKSATERTKANTKSGIQTGKCKEKKIIQIGWKHAVASHQPFAQVRKQCGGGVREILALSSDNLLKIQEEAINLFFPGGISKKCGRLSSLKIRLGDFSGEFISDLEMTIDQYKISVKMTGKPRLYLLTEKINLFKELLQSRNDGSDSDDFDMPASDEATKRSQLNEASDEASKRSRLDEESKNVIPLIGTSTERKQLFETMDKEFQESLAKDQEKERNKKLEEEAAQFHALKKEETENRLRQLQEVRKNRLLPEPNLCDPHVTVMVRHVTFGTKARLFNERSVFAEVCDWIGSLSTRPEFFELKEYNGTVISPEEQVWSGSYNMNEVEHPILMSPQGTVAFRGYGVSNVVENVVDLTDDVENTTNESVSDQEDVKLCFKETEDIRELEADKLTAEVAAFVRRENLYEDMIKLYKKRNTVTSKLCISFEGEEGIGDGVTKDAYSGFFESVYELFEGNFEKVPSTNVDEDLEIIGKTHVTHAFITYGVFPLQLCSCMMQFYLFGEADDKEILASFLNFLPRNESEIIRSFKEKDGNTQAITDILSDYSIFSTPTRQNIDQLCAKAGKVA